MIFETVKSVLDAIDEQGRADHLDWEQRLQASLISLEADYRKLTTPGRTPIDYGDLSTQAAYVYRYVYGHAEFFYDFLKEARKQSDAPLFDDTVLTVTGIGGGPGSELLGLLKYLDEGNGEPSVSRIIFTILDKESNWEHVAELLAKTAKTNIKIDLEFVEFDISSAKIPAKAFLDQEDAVFMSFFISEICALPNQTVIAHNISQLVKSMKAGTKLFYNDSNAYSFYSYVNRNVKSSGVLKEVLDINGKYTANSEPLEGIFADYQDDFGYGQKLNGSAVSKVLERV